MNPIEAEKMISGGIRRTEEEAEQFDRDFEAASQRICDTKGKMQRHEYLLRDRRMGKPPDTNRE